MQLHRPTIRNQSGFSVIEVLLIIFIVAALAVTGLVVYQHHKLISAKSSAATNSSQPTGQQQGTTRAQPQPATYLDIQEWGVRLKLDSDTASLYYYINPQIPNVAYLSLKTVSDVAPNCAADKGSLAAIGRLTEAEQQAIVSNSAPGIPGTIYIGNYWYNYDHSHAACTDGTAAMNDAVSKAAPNFNASTLQNIFKTLEAIPPSTIKIPDLGIQITVPGSIKDLTYRVTTVKLQNGAQDTLAYFSTATITNADPGCGTNFGPLGTLGRVDGQYPSSDPLAAGKYGQLVKQFPTFYISAGFPQAGCSTNNTAQGLAITGKTEFGQAESTIQQLN